MNASVSINPDQYILGKMHGSCCNNKGFHWYTKAVYFGMGDFHVTKIEGERLKV
jgi:hypothetical protein